MFTDSKVKIGFKKRTYLTELSPVWSNKL